MEKTTSYQLIFSYLDEEIFVWDTAITPIIPRQGEDIFLVTNLPNQDDGKWWTVQEVTYLYHTSENLLEPHQQITIHLEHVKLNK